jgi:hypothetical protein
VERFAPTPEMLRVRRIVRAFVLFDVGFVTGAMAWLVLSWHGIAALLVVPVGVITFTPDVGAWNLERGDMLNRGVVAVLQLGLAILAIGLRETTLLLVAVGLGVDAVVALLILGWARYRVPAHAERVRSTMGGVEVFERSPELSAPPTGPPSGWVGRRRW